MLAPGLSDEGRPVGRKGTIYCPDVYSRVYDASRVLMCRHRIESFRELWCWQIQRLRGGAGLRAQTDDGVVLGTIRGSSSRDQPVLPVDTREWLLARATRLQQDYDTLSTPLGRALVHADVQPDNLLQDRDGRWLLIDWDRASHGPRELDLAFAVPDHFHEPDSDKTEFSTAYGYDIITWTGWTLIRDLSELHSLASYIRRAATNPAARDELHRRVDSLVTTARSVVWRTVSG